MNSPLMKSISGIRGIVGGSLTPELIVSVSSAFAKYAKKGTVVVGRDSRPTGEAVSSGVVSTLALSGCDVIDIGMVPTPTVQVMVEETGAAGGIVVSASHNPVQWNAFKLINSSGTFLTPREIERVFRYMDGNFPYPAWSGVGSIREENSAGERHMERVLSVINSRRIRRRKFSVVLDSVNGAGSVITPELLRELGCEVHILNCTPDGIFPRGAEPVPENLADLSAEVRRRKADIGFAQDPDADRLAIVDETGRPIGEEYTVALVAEHLLSTRRGPVVVNLSTTKAVDDIAARYGSTVTRTMVGEIHVVEEMKKRGALIGGEGNGGVISPEVHYGRDSLAGIAYVLEMMAVRGKPLSDIINDLPAYTMVKGKVKIGKGSDNSTVTGIIKKEFRNEKVSTADGLRIDFKKHEQFRGGWVHLRPSNTEPVFRIIAEGMDESQAGLIYRHFAGRFK